MNNLIKITLKKSIIGRKPKHVQIVKQLGLRKINGSSIHKNIPSIQGLVKLVNYMVTVEEII